MQGGQTEMNIALARQDPSMPSNYALQYDVPPYPTYVFSEDEESQLAVEGNVEYRCDLKPEYSATYRGVVRGRLEKSMVKTRQLQAINTEEAVKDIKAAYRDTTMLGKRKLEDMRPEDRNQRVETSEQIQRLLKAFEKSERYDLKGLGYETKQSTPWLKDALTELCVYNKRGPHKGTYELKPQYKNKAKDPAQ
eukprot:TRINITY_DN1570_c0_g1_i4.p1 TRINITY_DN1570_c0_g1~~TRINITY_DN1570_c0_g1_i4.p1  ORF type:complete len:193 (-),score=46.17 TRINITY_DN1570_c0_g1_i4:61-639(-)